MLLCFLCNVFNQSVLLCFLWNVFKYVVVFFIGMNLIFIYKCCLMINRNKMP